MARPPETKQAKPTASLLFQCNFPIKMILDVTFNIILKKAVITKTLEAGYLATSTREPLVCDDTAAKATETTP